MNKEHWEAIGKYGFGVVAAVALGWVLYQFNVVPANEERNDAREERKANAKALLDASKEVSKTNQALSETNKSLAESYQKMSGSMELQAATNKATVAILEQIRDDQKKFPAVREANTKSDRP
jgi:hypothetical protein